MPRPSPLSIETLETVLSEKLDSFLRQHAEFSDKELFYMLVRRKGDRKQAVEIKMGPDSDHMFGIHIMLDEHAASDAMQNQVASHVATVLATRNIRHVAEKEPAPRPPMEPAKMEDMAAAIRKDINDIVETDPEFRKKPAGIFTINTKLATEKRDVDAVLILLHPALHQELSAKEEYFKGAHRLTYSTRQSDEAKRTVIRDQLKNVVERMGFVESTLIPKTNPEKIIPREWIDISRVAKFKARSSKYWEAIIVPRNHATRLPKIGVSTGIENEAQAEEAINAFKKDLLPQTVREDAPVLLTMGSVTDWFGDWRRDHGIVMEKDFKHPSSPQVFSITNPKGEEKCKVYRPAYNAATRLMSICVGPAGRSTKSASTIAYNLNTENEELARVRMNLINQVAIHAFRDYFAAHPKAELALEPRVRKSASGRDATFDVMQSQPERPYSVEPLADELYDALREKKISHPSPLLNELYAAFKPLTYKADSSFFLKRSIYFALEAKMGKPDTLRSALDLAAKYALDKFMDKHPNYEINARQGTLMLEVDREKHMDLKFLREQVFLPAAKAYRAYPRDLVWDVKMTATVPGEPYGTQRISLRALKEPFSQEVSMPEAADAPWDREVVLNAASPDIANRFTRDLYAVLLHDNRAGQKRPVTRFGYPSTSVVLRDSLAKAIKKNPEIIITEESRALVEQILRGHKSGSGKGSSRESSSSRR
jgi:hypothetical protein